MISLSLAVSLNFLDFRFVLLEATVTCVPLGGSSIDHLRLG